MHRLEALPIIAEDELSQCCKDISNAGLLGTISIMMENSAMGAVIDINRIPVPEKMGIIPWCLSFQGYGFVLSVHPENTKTVIDLFEDRCISAAVVGSVTSDRKIVLIKGSETETLFDFPKEKITGISCLQSQK